MYLIQANLPERILLTLPVTSVCCVRSFSLFRRLETWEWAIMGEERLCGLVVLHVHRDMNVSRENILRRFDEMGHKKIGTLQFKWQYISSNQPNIEEKVFTRLTQRLLERNRDIFNPLWNSILRLAISGLHVPNSGKSARKAVDNTSTLVYFRSLHICKNYHINAKYIIKLFIIYFIRPL
jgi:hypothetical protein